MKIAVAVAGLACASHSSTCALRSRQKPPRLRSINDDRKSPTEFVGKDDQRGTLISSRPKNRKQALKTGPRRRLHFDGAHAR